MQHSTWLSQRGYAIRKSSLSEEDLAKVKKALTLVPKTIPGYDLVPTETHYAYMESASALYVPKAYGLKHYGVPEIIKLPPPVPVNLEFAASLRPQQIVACQSVLEACQDPARMGGLLCLGCGQGKTVCGLWLICQLKVKTMIIAHKEFLLQQWRERIQQFIPDAKIGLIKAQDLEIEGCDIVLASLQSLSMKDYPPETFDGFGCVVYDEVHRTSAKVFSQVFRKVLTKYTIGLTATPDRKDGLTRIFQWNIGDIAYQQLNRSDLVHVQILKYSADDDAYNSVPTILSGKPNISRIINNITTYSHRNKFICKKITELANEGRRILVMSDRRNQLEALKTLLPSCYTSGYYWGGMSPAELKESEKAQIILCTYKYAEEGLDLKDMTTLVFASPKTDVVQCVGRILRQTVHTHTPTVIDIVDEFSVFPNQAKKRMAYYRSCNFEIFGLPAPARSRVSNKTAAPAFLEDY
jgi:superfamily II DNA or RNA helicase